MPDLMPGAEPFFFRGDSVGALLIHGFTGTPKEMSLLGEALAAEGHTALGVRLPQHGTAAADMLRSDWRDWYTAALDGYHLLRAQCETVFLMGLSMGGAIALKMSAEYPAAGVVAMSTPSQPYHDKMGWRAGLARWLSYLQPYVGKRPPAPDAAPRPYPRVAYTGYPTRAVPQFRAIIREAAAALPRVTIPVLLAHSRGDRLVPAENMPYIFARLASADKEMFWLDKSDHVITEDCERERLFAKIVAFVRAHARWPEAA
jgi:carboxylesterase